MKKLFFVLILSLCVLFSASAVNYQKVYSVDDKIIDSIDALYVMAGLSRPSSSGPYTGEELSEMLSRLDSVSLDQTAEALRDSIRQQLESDAGRTSTTVHACLYAEVSIHTNTSEAFQTKDNWMRNYNNQKPMGYLDFEHQLRENFYGFFEFSAGVSKHLFKTTEFGADPVSTNLLFVGPNNMSQFDFNFPHRAFIAAGGEGWAVQLGRDNLSWGLGKSGNLILGDHLQYHNALHFTTWTNSFKYTYVISAFAHPSEYYRYIKDHPELSGMYINGVSRDEYLVDGTPNPDRKDHPGQANVLKGISCFIGHRLEWRLLSDKLGLVVNEGILYMDEENKIDIMSFAPAFLYHNNYTRAQSNSILGFEADYAVLPGLNFYAAFCVDDFNLPGEAAPGQYVDGVQNLAEQTAFGLQLGAKYATTVADGILTVNAEAVKTDPYLYLRDGSFASGVDREQKVGQYGIRYVVAGREMIGAGEQNTLTSSSSAISMVVMLLWVT
ncbi:MAG: hypothetical protein KBS81_02520 [Spirochaetales bacterium]|nr:hypothetical protein [Candidatus Physcosoma equi]